MCNTYIDSNLGSFTTSCVFESAIYFITFLEISQLIEEPQLTFNTPHRWHDSLVCLALPSSDFVNCIVGI